MTIFVLQARFLKHFQIDPERKFWGRTSDDPVVGFVRGTRQEAEEIAARLQADETIVWRIIDMLESRDHAAMWGADNEYQPEDLVCISVTEADELDPTLWVKSDVPSSCCDC